MPDVAVSIIKELNPDGQRGGCGSWREGGSDGASFTHSWVGTRLLQGTHELPPTGNPLNLTQHRQVIKVLFILIAKLFNVYS